MEMEHLLVLEPGRRSRRALGLDLEPAVVVVVVVDARLLRLHRDGRI